MHGVRWFKMILYTVVLLVIVFIFKTDIIKSKNDKFQREISIYHRLLYYVAIMCFLMNIFAVLSEIMTQIPYICAQSYPLVLGWMVSVRATITLYQSGRLQYIFSDTQMHSKKYGYPKWIFIVLYSGYILYIIHLWIFVWIMYPARFTEDYHCAFSKTHIGKQWYYVGSVTYYLWDLACLFFYIYKICILKKVRFAIPNGGDKKIIKRINYSLNKITVLTLCYEFIGIISNIFVMYTEINKHGIIWVIVREIIKMNEHISGAWMIYLMIEHNDEEYQKVLRILNKCKLCYCIDDGYEEKEKQNVPQEMELPKKPTVDTKTSHPMPKSHIVNPNENSIVSAV